jgi:hypothetical protein
MVPDIAVLSAIKAGAVFAQTPTPASNRAVAAPAQPLRDKL